MSENSNNFPDSREGQGDKVLEQDDRLNETCTVSFEVPGYASFHFKPDVAPGGNMSLVMKEYRNYRAGLQELARRLDTAQKGNPALIQYAPVSYVAVTSWIVENNESILTGSGFFEDLMMAQSERLELVRVYKERQQRDGVLQKHRDIEPKCLRMSVDAFLQRHLKRS